MTIHATDETVYDIVLNEVEKLGPNADLNHIDVSKVTTFVFNSDENHSPFKRFAEDDIWVSNWMPLRFGWYIKKFNGDISQWDVSNVKYMCGLFEGYDKFNCDISGWDVSNVERTDYMFHDAKKFDQDLSKWNLGKLETSTNMFVDCRIRKEYLPHYEY